jgi:3-deoxy-7-phosphoheptulonate synthase
VLRGGAFKPRSSPYSFQGLGLDGLKILAKAREQTGLPIITEAVDSESLKMVNDWADIIQIGARNMQNFALLSEVGKLRKPVLLKRGMSATIDEWLMAAEYILSEGNDQLILAERGVRSFDSHTRNMLDLSAVPVLQSLSHLPVLVDPSHGTGKRHMVVPMSRGALAAGANAIMVDVHDQPEKALCDGPQAIHPRDFAEMVKSLTALASALGVKVE